MEVFHYIYIIVFVVLEMVKVNFNVYRRDFVWIGLLVVVVGFGLVYADNPIVDPNIHGHPSDILTYVDGQLCNSASCVEIGTGESGASTYEGDGGCYSGDVAIAYRREARTCVGTEDGYTRIVGDDNTFDVSCTGATSCTTAEDVEWLDVLPSPHTCNYVSERAVVSTWIQRCETDTLVCSSELKVLCERQ